MREAYLTEHQRVTRGAAIHKTKEEKGKVLIEKQKQEQKTKQVDSTQSKEEVEKKFLIPKVKNFVVTSAVEDYELRASVWLESGYPIHIIGPTGCGKTALAMHLAEKLKRPTIWMNGDEEITTTDLIGGYAKIEKRTLRDQFIHNVHKTEDIIEPQWVSNPLALACQNGYTLIYNEFSRAKPEANNILLSVLEEGILELPTKFGEERYIKVHPDFKLILTSNSIEYAGVHRPQDALLDRVAAIHMDYYDKETEKEIVKAHTKAAAEKAEKVVDLVRALRKKMDGAEKPGTRACIMIAQALKTAEKKAYNKMQIEQVCVDAIASKCKDLKSLSQKIDLVKMQIKELI